MSAQPSPVVVERVVERQVRLVGPAWVPLASAAVAAALLATTVQGSLAAAVTSRPAAAAPAGQAAGVAEADASAGSLLLLLRDDGGGFTQAVAGLAPGDSAPRYVDVVESGTLDGRDLRLTATATGPLGPALRVAVDACRGGAWTAASGACSGQVDRLLATTPVADLGAGRVLDPLGPARRLPLRLTLSLPDRQEQAVNGVLPPGSLQGAIARLRWRFTVVQA